VTDSPSGFDEIYDAARRLPAGERHTFLRNVCGQDDRLREELESLLQYDTAAGEFLERSALHEAAAALACEMSALVPGTMVAGYQIAGSLGSGGMGDVYRASDLRLGRDVALKVLDVPPGGDPTARRRFEHEARAASALSHPNIVTIYAVGEADGVAFIAMELVNGETLRQRLSRGPFPPEAAVDVAIQIASAVAAAHAAGIVHRDLKPENIMVTGDGLVKVLDFGIARRQGTADQSPHTAGTAAYMAPEQRAGEPGDARSDQYALGAVIAEVFTGRRPAQLPAAAWNVLPRKLRPSLRAIVERATAPRPRDRYASVDDVANALRGVQRELRRGGARAVSRRQVLIAGAAVLGLGAGAEALRRALAGRAIASLAILPFRNVSGDARLDTVCSGFTDTLIELLASPSLRVMARSTVSHFADAADPRAAGRTLGVEAVLAGSVSAATGGLHVRADLIDVASGASLWTRSYDRAAADVALIRTDIVRALLDDGLHLALASDERHRLERRLSVRSDAYDFYLRALQEQRQGTEDGYLRAQALLRQAVTADPGFAEAFAALAATYSVLAVEGYMHPASAWRETESNVRHALALDAALPNAHAEAATHLFYARWDFRGAQREWETALQGRAGDTQPDFLIAYAMECWATRRSDAAIALARRARTFDPYTPAFGLSEADFLLTAGYLDEAAAGYAAVIGRADRDARAFFGLAEARRRQGRLDEAYDALRAAFDRAGRSALVEPGAAGSGAARFEALERAGARADLEDLRARAAYGGYVSPLETGRVHARLGNTAAALACLPQAFDERSPGLVFLAVDRAWDAVRGEPAFRTAMARVGLAT
jgi:serine/threonine-protein kinase